MRLKSKALAAGAITALSLAVAAGTAAQAATPSCGSSCVNIYPKQFETFNTNHPNYVLDVFRQGEKIGQPIILWHASNHDPAEDFTYSFQGVVSDFFAAGLLGSAVNIHYGCGFNPATGTCANRNPDDPAYELEYSPFGVDSGLCVGTGSVAAAGTLVSLQPCGTSARTVWIQDTYDSGTAPFFAAINGSTTTFSHPFVMTYPNGFPTDLPRPQLRTQNLAMFSTLTVDDNQAWYAFGGVLP